MERGCLVILVDDRNFFAPYVGDTIPVRDTIYTIRDIHWDGGAIVLEEIINAKRQYSNGVHELYFVSYRFAKLDTPISISIEEMQHELV